MSPFRVPRTAIYANGNKLAISMGEYDNVHFFDGAIVNGLSWSMEMSGMARIGIDLIAPIGLTKSIPYENARALFATANELSVEELLAAVYRKMEERG